MKPERTAKVTALEAVTFLLEDDPLADKRSFQYQIELINAFTNDILNGKLDLSESDINE